jgi:catechol-2,3-dioxygenase
MPATPSHFAHVVYLTSRYETLIGWYQRVLNAHVVFRNDNIRFLTYDDEHHRLAIVHVPDLAPRPAGTTGVHHVAYSFANLDDLLSTYERLKGFGILPFWSVNHGPTTSLYYRDPDGNQTEFQVDNFATAEETARYFTTGDFAENPIGVEFDAEDLLRRLRSGAPEYELKRRPRGPASPIR